MITPPICPYCIKEALLVTGKEIYPHRPDLYKLFFWRCEDCGAFVGTHKNSHEHKPLGTLANTKTRKARMAAHAAFDPLWKNGKMKRKEAYKWLAGQLKIDVKGCHISWFDAVQCEQVVSVCNAR